MSEPGIKKALTIEEIFQQNEQDRRLYELREKAIRDEISMMAGARREGRAEGEEIGQVRGGVRAIAKFLAARFGPESSDLRARVGELTDPAVVDRVFAQLFIANSLEKPDASLMRPWKRCDQICDHDVW